MFTSLHPFNPSQFLLPVEEKRNVSVTWKIFPYTFAQMRANN